MNEELAVLYHYLFKPYLQFLALLEHPTSL